MNLVTQFHSDHFHVGKFSVTPRDSPHADPLVVVKEELDKFGQVQCLPDPNQLPSPVCHSYNTHSCTPSGHKCGHLNLTILHHLQYRTTQPKPTCASLATHPMGTGWGPRWHNAGVSGFDTAVLSLIIPLEFRLTTRCHPRLGVCYETDDPCQPPHLSPWLMQNYGQLHHCLH